MVQIPLSEEQQLLRKTVRDFVAKEVEPQAARFDREERWNEELFGRLAELGLLGITVPEQFGGSEMGPVEVVIAHEELSTADPGFCLAYLAHALLCVNNIAVNGSDAQKEKYLPKLCSGEWIGAMGMSEAGAGTDVLAMASSAVKDSSGRYELNGSKMWITNGSRDGGSKPCDLLFLYASTGSRAGDRAEISSFLVEGGDKGFSVGQMIKDKLGMRASYTAELVLNGCMVPADRLVGEEGDSLRHMMKNLEIERLGLAAMSLGIARRSLETMVQYANERKAFGAPLREFGQIQHAIAVTYAEYQAAKCYVYQTASQLTGGKSARRLDSDGVKLFAAPVGKQAADRAIQVLGGNGYIGEYVVERLWRDAKLLEIGGGTLEAHEKNITKDLCKDPSLL